MVARVLSNGILAISESKSYDAKMKRFYFLNRHISNLLELYTFGVCIWGWTLMAQVTCLRWYDLATSKNWHNLLFYWNKSTLIQSNIINQCSQLYIFKSYVSFHSPLILFRVAFFSSFPFIHGLNSMWPNVEICVFFLYNCNVL